MVFACTGVTSVNLTSVTACTNGSDRSKTEKVVMVKYLKSVLLYKPDSVHASRRVPVIPLGGMSP